MEQPIIGAYFHGQRLRWTPRWWRWDTERTVTVVRVYPSNRALLSNGVMVDEDGFATSYGPGREVGTVAAMPQEG